MPYLFFVWNFWMYNDNFSCGFSDKPKLPLALNSFNGLLHLWILLLQQTIFKLMQKTRQNLPVQRGRIMKSKNDCNLVKCHVEKIECCNCGHFFRKQQDNLVSTGRHCTNQKTKQNGPEKSIGFKDVQHNQRVIFKK